MKPVRIGTILYHGGGSQFGHGTVRVEAIGADWVVARDGNGVPWLANYPPEWFEQYTEKDED